MNANEVYKHYGIEKDMVAVKSKEINGVDFLIGKEADIKELTADMAGFGIERSQKVNIELHLHATKESALQ